MNHTPVTETLSVSGQISPSDVAAIAAAGFRSIICNRPDHEAADQPRFAAIEAAAAALGLATAYLPVTSGAVTEADVDAFAALLATMPAPILAFCRSGARSTTLCTLVKQARGPQDGSVP